MTLLLRKVAILLVLVLALPPYYLSSVDAEGSEGVIDINLEKWRDVQNEGKKLLLLMYKSAGCDLCTEAVDEFATIIGQPEIPSGVALGKSEDSTLQAHLGISKVPALLFLRDKSYVIYDGQIEVESMLQWIPLAAEVALKRLGDDSFEHLTQASTGATTGDWLVAFTKSGCQNVVPMLETVGVSFRGRVNVAEVDMASSPELVQRFQVKACPHIIYFRQGKMYRYDIPTLDAASLRSFLDGFYKNSKAESVPIPKSKFDFVTEGIADFLKEQMEGENRIVVLAGVCGLAIFFLLVIFLCCRSILEPPPKQKDE